MPQHKSVHRQYPLHLYYPEHFSDHRMIKYWVATSSDDIYDTSEINDSGWSLIELPFESKNIWLGNRVLLFHTTQNLLVLNRFVAQRVMSAYKIFEKPLMENEHAGVPFYIFNIQKLVDTAFEVNGTVDATLKCYELHRVVSDSSIVYFEMTNGVLISLRTEDVSITVDTRFLIDRIKLIEVSGQSPKVVIYTEGHKLYNTDTNIPIDHITSPIKLITASPVSIALVTLDNQFYLNGDDSNGTCGGMQTGSTEIKLAPIQFPKEKIVDVKCGYIHTVILLENGKVWASGYNDLKQCGREGAVKQFTEIEETYYKYGHFRRIKCTSRGTVLISDSHATFIGEVVHKFQQYKDRVLVEPLNPEFNEVAAGGWQYVLFNRVSTTTKSLTYFMNNLKQLSNSMNDNEFRDCEFILKHNYLIN